MTNTNKLEIVVNFETEETKTFHQPNFIKGSVIREGVKLGKEMEDMESELDADIIDKMCEFVANKLYDGQFTSEELMDGIDARQLLKTLIDQISNVLGGGESNEGKPSKAKKA